jgi:tetratricopeptide (TPR) repeat protein
MKRLFFFLLASFSLLAVNAQEQTPLENGRSFLRAGDFDNAILVLNRGLQADPKNIELQKELAMAFYYKRDYAKAKDVVEMLLDNDDADIMAFQVAGNVYKAMEEVKDAEKMYKKALRKFPKSGALYSEYGELKWAKKETDAIELWEKGIKEDPSYAGNYYNAALFYYYTKDKVWTLVYGEIFVNMESLTERAASMKGLLLSAYKEKLFADADILADQGGKNIDPFAKSFLETMGRQANLVSRGINAEVLTMIRTRFILDWYKNNSAKFPFRLFDYQQQLIREGMFDAYNQWLFGMADNLPAYENWTRTHNEAFQKFTNFQMGRIFKIPQGQYYKDL